MPIRLKTRAPAAPPASEEASCSLCGGGERRLEFREGFHSVVTCTRCDLTYVTPRLAAAELLRQVYDAAYWRSPAASTRGYADYRRDAPLYLATFRRRLARVRDHLPPPGRVLDVGCAAGYFLAVMREEGWRVSGVEPSESILDAAEALLGPGVVEPGTLENAPLEPASFDLITFWDVLEHLPDPLAALRRARELLAPGGRVLVETQNVRSRLARVLGPRWQHYKHAEHLHHFHPGTLARALAESGLELMRMGPRGGGKYVSASFVAERSGRLHRALPILLAPVALASRLLRAPGLYVNLRDEIVAIARARGG